MGKAVAAMGGAAAIAAFLLSLPLLPPLKGPGLFALGWALAAAWGSGWILLRDAGLAALTAAAPLPGLAVALAAHGAAGLAAYGFGFAAALALADVGARRLLDGTGPPDFTLAALPFLPVALAGTVVLASLAGAWRLGLPLAACALSASLLMPAVIAFLPFGEHFFTRANRAREARLQLLALFSLVTTPRWSVSFTGVALVLAVLGRFTLHTAPAGLGTIAVALAVWFAVRDFRAAFAAAFAALLFGLYAQGALVGLAGLALFTTLLAARLRPDPGEWGVALEEEGAGIIITGLGLALILAPIAPRDAFGVLAGLSAALLFFPAFAGLITMVWPRARALEEIYRS